MNIKLTGRVCYSIVSLLDFNWIFVGLLQLPDIRKQFSDVSAVVFFLIIWKPGNNIIQPFPWIDFLCLAGGKQRTNNRCIFCGFMISAEEKVLS